MEKNIPLRFSPEPPNGFYDTLRARAAQYLADKTTRPGVALWLFGKVALLLTTYLFAYGKVVAGSPHLLFWYSLMGFLTVPLILNIGHEAVHGTLTASPVLNRCCTYIFNLLGADGAIWRKRHVLSHHVFPNIPGYDSDITQNQLARISPRSVYLPAHRFQHWYMPMLYLLYTLNWLLYRDFKDCRRFYSGQAHYRIRLAMLLLGKLFYFGYVLLLPLCLHPEGSFVVLTGFLLMQFVMSATTFLVLVSAHVGEYAVFPEPGPDGCMAQSWSVHQLQTTTDFASGSLLVTQLFGGFNHHVAHHLFPQVSHLYYPALTAITRDTAREFGLSYQCFPTLGAAILSHFRFLKNNSLPPHFFEEADI